MDGNFSWRAGGEFLLDAYPALRSALTSLELLDLGLHQLQGAGEALEPEGGILDVASDPLEVLLLPG